MSQTAGQSSGAAESAGRGPGPFVSEFQRQFERLKRLVMGMGLDVSDAEDVLQDVAVQVLRHEEGQCSDDNPAAWLFKVTANRVRLEHRRRGMAYKGTSEAMLRSAPADIPDAAAQASGDEQRQIIAKALDEMDEDLRMPLVLRYFCDQDSGQIGQVLDLPASTVRSRLRSARMDLAHRLVSRGIEP